MRKVLLATTALVGVALASAAHAEQASPITLNVGGYDDFVAGHVQESQGVTPGLTRSNGDFENEFKINFDALGKARNGIEYGANVSLWNGPEVTNLWTGGGNSVEINSAYVWLSGAFGKVLMGDEHGASDLQVYAPTVGEGQVDGRFQDFTSPFTLARVYASGIDNTEHSTKITYYTPKVGNDLGKVQLGVSYAPDMYDYGSNVVKFQALGTSGSPALLSNGAMSPYKNDIKGAAEFWGNWKPVTLAASANIQTADAGATGSTNPAMFAFAPAGGYQDFTSFGVGAQLGLTYVAGLTFGGSYQDLGRYGTTHGQNKTQDLYTVGAKYEFDKVGLGVSYLTSSQYDNLLTGGTAAGFTTTNTNYVSSYNAEGIGATYTWFPGLTTNGDAVFFQQGVSNQADTNNGYALLVSQRLAF